MTLRLLQLNPLSAHDAMIPHGEVVCVMMLMFMYYLMLDLWCCVSLLSPFG